MSLTLLNLAGSADIVEPKKKIYLDTSVISHLEQHDAPEKVMVTRKFWELCKAGKFDICISTVVMNELYKCPVDLYNRLLSYLDEIIYIYLEVVPEDYTLADYILVEKVLPPKSRMDALHLAIAMREGCDCVVSLNYKHMLKYRAVSGIRRICLQNNFAVMDVCPPGYFLEED